MATETIQVYIDQGQLAAQKNNGYSLYLAKMVNGFYTIIWQSMGPVATVNNPSYEYSNSFDITIPSYNVNYTSSTLTPGIAFTSGGMNQPIDVGQQTNLDANGIFSSSVQGAAGVINVNNSLQGNPHEVLLDASGNNVFVNTQSGMDIGVATLTPIDTYQIWFGSYQETGTIIANNLSNVGTVTFSGETTQTISYDAAGAWVAGPLTSSGDFQLDKKSQTAFDELSALIPNSVVEVIVALTPVLTIAALTYLANNLINKFAGNLKPSSISKDGDKLKITFSKRTNLVRAVLGGDAYENAAQAALQSAKSDPNFKLTGESWSMTENISNLY